MLDTEVLIRRVASRRVRAPLPGVEAYPPVVNRYARSDPTRGWLVGATDGAIWGWWGPVTRSVAANAVQLFASATDADLAMPVARMPSDWAAFVRSATRHTHTGALAVSIGAFELACWDLVGRRADAPVWALSDRTEPSPPRLATYATCFGVDVVDSNAVSVAESLNAWPVQKWDGVALYRSWQVVDALAAASGGDDRLALDFRGRVDPSQIVALAKMLSARLAWVEEPRSPDQMHLSSPGEFGVPHAAGEHCYGPYETAVLAAAGVDVWQPDAVFCGGYAALQEILEIAAMRGARATPHGGGFLPAIHAMVTGAPTWLVEYHLLLEPRRQTHLERPLRPDFETGLAPAPMMPGWGGPLASSVRGGHDD